MTFVLDPRISPLDPKSGLLAGRDDVGPIAAREVHGDPEPVATHDLAGPDPATIVHYIRETYPQTAVLESGGTWFFSLDPEKHFPDYATIVTTNDYDDGSDLDREGVFRLNLGLGRPTFERLVGAALDPAAPHDHRALDAHLPHPTYAAQL